MINQQLTKYLASHGPWSRRQAEALIRAGRVAVDNQIAQLGQIIGDDNKIVKVDGRTVAGKDEPMVYFMLNKPSGYTCTSRDFRDEHNVFELVDYPGRLFVVGRLDKESRGLVLLTNDGELTERLTHPRFAHVKVYEATIRPGLAGRDLSKLKDFLAKGHRLYEDQGLATADVGQQLATDRLEIILRQGQKRQIRLLMKAAGYEVTDLKRVALGSLRLGRLPVGASRPLTHIEIDRLLHLAQDRRA
ncbi:rRNA pseudouridine synthase [Candidatus Falkowbacteria bacterium]|nr:rRNA pseudouridine synthase [Candidatus Falkowbacteria bacterium]